MDPGAAAAPAERLDGLGAARSTSGPLRVVETSLEIDRAALRARLRRGGRVVWSAPVGIGAPGTPTPAGRFYVREKLRNAGGDPLYGPWAIGTSAYSRLSEWPGGGVVGIHGTDQPNSSPGARRTAACA